MIWLMSMSSPKTNMVCTLIAPYATTAVRYFCKALKALKSHNAGEQWILLYMVDMQSKLIEIDRRNNNTHIHLGSHIFSIHFLIISLVQSFLQL